MLADLSREDRLRLIKFVCSFAWADLAVNDAERSYVAELVKKLELDEKDARQARGWLDRPPRPDEVDPADVPLKHREVFLQAAREVILHDGNVDDEERMSLALFDQLLR